MEANIEALEKRLWTAADQLRANSDFAALRPDIRGVLPQLACEPGTVDHLPVDDAEWDPAPLNVQNRSDIGGAVAGKALVRLAQRMRRQDDIVELQQRVVGAGRFELENIQSRPGDPSVP
jgi:hypothetical protein